MLNLWPAVDVLFSQDRDNALENCFSQISSYSPA